MKFSGIRHTTNDTALRTLADQLVGGVELLEFDSPKDLQEQIIHDLFPDNCPDGTAVTLEGTQVWVKVNGAPLASFTPIEN
ncbi:MAG TPA: hypothetical protein PLB89_05090 [Flavobacteriales bacterium]|nr:hypothetical protein [Flavobacteriales bacterium]